MVKTILTTKDEIAAWLYQWALDYPDSAFVLLESLQRKPDQVFIRLMTNAEAVRFFEARRSNGNRT